MRRPLAVLILMLSSTSASAASISIMVKTAAGQPVKDAVVTLTPAGGVHAPIKFDWPMRMAQQNIQFEPFVLIAPVGADVSFPNLDKVRHHVYSFSPTKRFELKLYGKDETRTVHFDKPGMVGPRLQHPRCDGRLHQGGGYALRPPRATPTAWSS